MLRLFRRIPGKLTGIALAVAAAYDPYMPSTSALVRSAGAGIPVNDANTGFSSNNILACTALLANYAYFSGTGYAVITNSGDLSLTADFTVEAWICPTQQSINAANCNFLTQWQQGSTATGAWGLGLSGGKPIFCFGAYSQAVNMLTAPDALSAGEWAHLAVTRSGSLFTLWVNGLAVATATFAGAGLTTATNVVLGDYIASTGAVGASGNTRYQGGMDGVRVTKGLGLYTENFTPSKSLSTGASDPNWANVVLAMDFETGVTDLKGHTVTNTGVEKLIPGKNGASVLYFNGTNSNGTIPSTPNTAYPAGVDFTAEMFINMPVLPSASGYILMDNTVNGGGFNIVVAATNIQIGRSWIGTDHTFNYTWTADTWYHIAVVRVGTTLYCYVNGTLIGTATNNIAYAQGSVVVGIGGNYSSLPYKGYMSDFRLTRGVARYRDTTAVVPTSEFPTTLADDSNWNNTSLLLKMNSYPFVDEKGNTITPQGSITSANAISTTTMKFGAGSFASDNGANKKWLRVPHNANLEFGASDFTIEGWLYPTSAVSSGVYGKRADIDMGFSGVVIFTDTTSGFKLRALCTTTGNSWTQDITTSNTLNLNDWNHFALSRVGNMLYLFLNGTLGAVVNIGTAAIAGNTYDASIGSTGLGTTNYANQMGFKGNIDEFRITKGVGRYGVKFTAPTDVFYDYRAGDYYWDQTVLLLKMNSDDFIDEKGNTILPQGAGATTGAIKKFGQASFASDNGTVKKWLRVPHSSDFEYGSGDFTIEGWLFPTAATVSGVYGKRTSMDGVYNAISIQTDTTSGFKLRAMFSTTGSSWTQDITSTNTLNLNEWNHFAVTRVGTTLYIFVNGVMGATATIGTGALISNTTDVSIGAAGLSSSLYAYALGFKGNIDEFRITKGVGRYSGNFTVPKTEFPTFGSSAVGGSVNDPTLVNAVVHLRMDDLTDEIGHTVTNNGGVTISTATKKYGSGAAYFNGTNNLSIADSAEFNYNGRFSIEGWFNSPTDIASATTTGILSKGTSTTGWVVRIDGNLLKFGYNSSVITGNLSWKAGAWNHFAITRDDAGLIRMFLNGALCGSATVTNDLTTTQPLLVGADRANTNRFTGYLDEVRLAMDVARYVDNFDVPTSAIPALSVTGDPYWQRVALALTAEQSNVVDLTDHSIINNGVVVSATNPYMGSGSLYFGGTQWMKMGGAGSDFNFGTGDFTIEFAVKFPSAANNAPIMDFRTLGSAGGFLISTGGALSTAVGVLRIADGNTNIAVSTSRIDTGNWVHCAVVRRAGIFMLFVNGVLEAAASYALTITPASYAPVIGTNGFSQGGSFMTGYMDEVRVTRGVARYTGKFTVPAGSFTTYTAANDPQWGRTYLSLDFDGADGSSAFVDRVGNVVNKLGSPKISTSKSKWGTGSLNPGAAGNCLSIPTSARWDFSASDGTIELWVYMPSGFGFTSLIGQMGAALDGNWGAYIYANGKIAIGRTGVNEIGSATGVFVADQWNHLAFVKQNGTTTIYYNGVAVASAATAVFNASTNPLYVGAAHVLDQSASMNGYMEDIRISGFARYSSAFGTPRKLISGVTGPTTDMLNKYVTFQLDGESLTDKSSAKRTLSGTATAVTTICKSGAKSLYFPTGAYLTAGSNADMLFGADDFTVEAWVYPTLASAQYGMGIASTYTSVGGDKGWIFSVNRSDAALPGSILFSLYNTGGVSAYVRATGANVPINAWSHVAAVRRNGTVYLFLNGVLVASGALTTSDNYVGTLLVGTVNGGALGNSTATFTGYIDELRITKGAARYLGNFIPPGYSLPLAA